MHNLNTTFLLIFYFLLGTAVGSFINVWSRRLLRGESLTGRSKCEHCGHELSALDLVPLFSFASLGGHCRYCEEKLSWQYPIVEGATGLTFLGLALRFGLLDFNLNLLTGAFLFITVSSLIVIFITDLYEQVIADQVLWVGVGGALGFRVLNNFFPISFQFSLLWAVLGALGSYLFFQAIRLATKGRGMGDGDPPLSFLAALLVGFPGVLLQIFLSFVVGGVVGAFLVAFGRKKLKSKIAFGPFLVAATFITLFWGEAILDWYLRILGL